MPSPKKYFGQHFLHDQNILQKLVDFIAPKKTDHLIEIGPGAGALTKKILPLVNKLDVIEIDKEIIPTLKTNCENSSKLQIHIGDVLKTDFTKFNPPIRLIGNLPYNISTPILFHIIEATRNVIPECLNRGSRKIIKDMHFMLQKEVAERIAAKPNSKIYGRLSVMIQYYFETKILLKIGPKAFSPPPKVDSAFIRLMPRKDFTLEAENNDRFAEIVRTAFSQRRKVIANSLKKQISEQQLKKIGINSRLRPEQLSVNDFVSISNNALQ